MEFKWSVDKLTVAQDNLVIRVDLKVTATDGDNTTSAVLARNLVRGNSFTPYAQLTEQQVIDWCFEPIVSAVADENNEQATFTRFIKNEGETQVAMQIALQVAQRAVEPALPWV
jgi:hypothetical protein